MFKLLRRLIVLAAVGGAVSYFVRRRNNQDDLWGADDPDADWGVERSEPERPATP